MGFIAFSPYFGHNSQVFVKSSSFFLIIKKILVDGFMAYRKIEILINGMRHLFGTIIKLDQKQNYAPLFCREIGSTPGALASGGCVAVRYTCGVTP